jgi:hypothetical protein
MSQQYTRREVFQLAAAGGGLTAITSTALFGESLPQRRKSVSVEETIHTDVLVVGAGASGIPAAIAAAREGAKVILVEEDTVLGGAPVDMYVAMLCGGPRVGIYREMIHHLNAQHDLSGKPDPGFGKTGEDGRNHWYLPASYVAVLTAMIRAENNVTLMCGARPIEIIVSDKEPGRRRVQGALITRGPEKLVRILAKVTIDATGTGEVATQAGCITLYGREARGDYGEPFGPDRSDDRVQRCTWMYISQRIRPDAVFDPSRLKNRGMVEDKIDHWVGKDPQTSKRNAGIYLHWGATVQCSNTRDPVAIARAQQEALSVLQPDFAWLLNNGFAVHLAPRLGVREQRRVLGEHVVTVNDLKSGKFPEDVIALSDYGLDPWGEKLTKEQIECPRFGIPYRALIPKDTERLLVAGKSISGTHLAASSYRVQPIVAGIGQAAGTAAAMAVRLDTNIRSIPIGNLQTKLRNAGVLIT